MAQTIDERLQHWGKWCCRGSGIIGVQGYSSQTVLSRFARDGGIIVGTRGHGVILVDIEAEEIEYFIGRLRGLHPKIVAVVEDRYVFNYPYKDIISYRGISEKTIKSRLNEGRMWLEGALFKATNPRQSI